MKRFGPLLILCVVAGCSAALPDPKITAVTPPDSPASAVVPLKVQLDAVLPSRVDYSATAATVENAATLFIGDTNVGETVVDADGAAMVVVPTILVPGSYDVKVTLADGRSATASSAFTVTPGIWPTGYTIDPFDAPTAGTPFNITVRAQGPAAPNFNGNVTLDTSKGNIDPRVSGAFQGGVLVQSVTLNGKGNGFVITVKDASGATGATPTFKVN